MIPAITLSSFFDFGFLDNLGNRNLRLGLFYFFLDLLSFYFNTFVWNDFNRTYFILLTDLCDLFFLHLYRLKEKFWVRINHRLAVFLDDDYNRLRCKDWGLLCHFFNLFNGKFNYFLWFLVLNASLTFIIFFR